MSNKLIYEKKHILSDECYAGINRISFTLCVKDRKKIFTNKEIIEIFVNFLTEAKNKHNCKVLIYLFMPDHLHLILEGKNKESDLKEVITLFKQKTGYWLSKNMPQVQWQKNFYDHIHRKEEDLSKHICYILENPIRKGLSDSWVSYPFKGSLDIDLGKL